MNEVALVPYQVQAYNTAHASENKIHDDGVARRLGFSGGLVPGIEVYAYASHQAVAAWGCDWLERGHMNCRLLKPVYDGNIATIDGTRTGTELSFTVESLGATCATGSASLPEAVSAAPDLDLFPYVPPPEDRPAVSPEALPEGRILGTAPLEVTPEYASTYLANARETHPLYAADGLVHPGIILRFCNWAVSQNVRMPAWIHTGSAVEALSAARVGDVLTGRGRVLANYDRKGHKMIDVDVLVVANAATPIARVKHTAIYMPRQLAATA